MLEDAAPDYVHIGDGELHHLEGVSSLYAALTELGTELEQDLARRYASQGKDDDRKRQREVLVDEYRFTETDIDHMLSAGNTETADSFEGLHSVVSDAPNPGVPTMVVPESMWIPLGGPRPTGLLFQSPLKRVDSSLFEVLGAAPVETWAACFQPQANIPPLNRDGVRAELFNDRARLTFAGSPASVLDFAFGLNEPHSLSNGWLEAAVAFGELRLIFAPEHFDMSTHSESDSGKFMMEIDLAILRRELLVGTIPLP